MRVVIQRVSEASVTINTVVTARIKEGFLILLGITDQDSLEDIEWLTNKIKGMRIFSDAHGAMNLSLDQIDGNVLVVSQFTLYASTKKGNRPSFVQAARPEVAVPLYEEFVSTLSRKLNKSIQTGQFGADMKVALVNDGPVTIIVDSKSKE